MKRAVEPQADPAPLHVLIARLRKAVVEQHPTQGGCVFIDNSDARLLVQHFEERN